MTNEQLKQLLAILRENNVTRFKSAEVELVFGAQAPEFPDIPLTKREELEAKEEAEIAFAHVGRN